MDGDTVIDLKSRKKKPNQTQSSIVLGFFFNIVAELEQENGSPCVYPRSKQV